MMISKILLPAAMLISLLAVTQVNAAKDDVVDPFEKVVDKKACEDAGGVYTESPSGNVTSCKIKDETTTCIRADLECETCGPDGKCDPVEKGFSSGLTVDAIVADKAAVAPNVSQPEGTLLPTKALQQSSTIPLVAPSKETSKSPVAAPINQNANVLSGRVQTNAPSRLDVGQPAGNNNDVGAVPLSQNECTTLGGAVFQLPACKSGSACQTTDESGTKHTVCLTKTVLAPTFDLEDSAADSAGQDKPSTSKSPSRFENATLPTAGTMATPLTSQECAGLGGTVQTTNKCNAKGQKACATVDQHGVVRVACINQASK